MINIIRTSAVELETIPALAFKQKLQAGGAGVKIIRMDREATAVFTIDKRSGEGVPYGKVDEKLFPQEAVEEAIEQTIGLPYAKRGKLNVKAFLSEREPDDVCEEDEEDKIDMVGSEEYDAIVARYTDEKGKLNYKLMNKDFMSFANKSKVVSDMVGSGANEEDILRFIVKNRATVLTGKKESLSDKETDALIETLDEIDTRGAFKELKAYIRRQLARPSIVDRV